MIAVPTLLAGLQRRGVTITAADGQLRYRERWEGAFSPNLRQVAERHRAALLAVLTPRRSPTCAGCGRFHFPVPGVRCFWCGRGFRALPDRDSTQRVDHG